MIINKRSNEESDWAARYIEKYVDLSLPVRGSLICIDRAEYRIVGLAEDGYIVLLGGNGKYQIKLDKLVDCLEGYSFYWCGQTVPIHDVALVSKLISEMKSSWDYSVFERPPSLPLFPERRDGDDGSKLYERPSIVSSLACLELISRFLGIESLPVAIAFKDYEEDRKEAFVATAMCPVSSRNWCSDGIEIIFSGYKLHSNGLLGDPVSLIRVGRKAFRRTLSNKWVELNITGG